MSPEKNNSFNYLFISNTDFEKNKLTGAHRRFIELVMGAAKKSKVLVLSNYIPQLENEECKKNITFSYLNKTGYVFFPYHIKTLFKLVYKLISLKPIAFKHAIAFGPIQTVAYWLAGYHNIISLFRENLIGYSIACNNNKYKEFYLRLQEILAVRASKKIIVQCNNDKIDLIERTKKYCKTIEKKIVVQTNNCNASWMKKEAHHGVTYNNIPKILFVGDFSSPRKGHQLIIPAVAKLLDEDIKCELYVCGDGISKNEWQKKYNRYKQIKFCGYVKTDDYLRLCDFMVVPSMIDSCPNTILEALNAGLAVYGTNTGGIPEQLLSSNFMFNPDLNSLYIFLKRIIINKSYINDSLIQKNNKRNLTFDWSARILNNIETYT